MIRQTLVEILDYFTPQTLSELLVLLLCGISSARIFFLKNVSTDPISVIPVVAFLISILNFFAFGLSLLEILVWLVALSVFVWNIRALLRFKAQLVVDHYGPLFVLISLVNLVLTAGVAAVVIIFCPAHASLRTFHVTVTTTAYSGNFTEGFVPVTQPLQYQTATVKRYESSIPGTQRGQTIVFVPPECAGIAEYEPFLVKLAHDGFTVYAAEFYTDDMRWFGDYRDGRFVRKFNFRATRLLNDRLYQAATLNKMPYLLQEYAVLVELAERDGAVTGGAVAVPGGTGGSAGIAPVTGRGDGSAGADGVTGTATVPGGSIGATVRGWLETLGVSTWFAEHRAEGTADAVAVTEGADGDGLADAAAGTGGGSLADMAPVTGAAGGGSAAGAVTGTGGAGGSSAAGAAPVTGTAGGGNLADTAPVTGTAAGTSAPPEGTASAYIIEETSSPTAEPSAAPAAFVFIAADTCLPEADLQLQTVWPRVVYGSLDLSTIPTYTTPGYGPIEQTAPLLARILGHKKDRHRYMASHLATVLEDAVTETAAAVQQFTTAPAEE